MFMDNNTGFKVSIIIPCYKVEFFLPTCIESVLKQSYQDWELILVDDGSPDRSGEICDEYSKRDSRIKVIHKLNGGLSDARNAGLDIMTGDFITFLDSDDFWHHDYLKIMMNLQKQYDADIVQCKWIRGTATEFPKVTITNKVVCQTGSSAMANGFFDVVMWGKIYKRSMLNGIRMPVGLVNEDDWTSWKICYRAKCFVSSPNKLYYYTVNQHGICAVTSRIPDLTFFGAFEEKDRYFKRCGDNRCTVWNLEKWNKAIILRYRYKGANEEQRKQMMLRFKENLKNLCIYPQFNLITRWYFSAFIVMPRFLSKLSSVVNNIIRNRRISLYKRV
jgi:glycosyltransferase involved in cell wall biosynthesis